MRALWALPLLSACAAVPADPSLEGRRECVKLMTAPQMRGAADFLALGDREARAAGFFGNAEEGSRRLRCAVAAFEAATRLAPDAAAPYERVAAVYAALGKEFLAAEARAKAGARKKKGAAHDPSKAAPQPAPNLSGTD